MNTRFSLLLTTLALSLCTFAQQPKFVIQGECRFKTDSIEVSYYDYESKKYMLNKCVVKDGKFYFEEAFTDYRKYEVGRYYVWNVPDTIKVVVYSDKVKVYNNPVQDEYNIAESYDYNSPERLEFIHLHPKSVISAEVLYKLLGIGSVTLDEAKKEYRALDSMVQRSPIGKIVLNEILRHDKIREGRIAPDFSALERFADGTTKPIRLSDFLGRVVLLDFWTPTCGPCIGSFPRTKALYEKYKDKGLSIVAVNLDYTQNSKDWFEQRKKQDINQWHHVYGAENYRAVKDDEIFALYNAKGVPVRILVDQWGVIKGYWSGASDEVEDQIEQMVSALLE